MQDVFMGPISTKSRILVLFLFSWPVVVYANGPTPLMVAGMWHLLAGNLIIGIIEAALVASIFKVKAWRATLILIAANYVSAFAGVLFVGVGIMGTLDITIETLKFWFAFSIILMMLITLLIEFPFYIWALRKEEKRTSKAFMSVVIAHGVTYMALFAWYAPFTDTSLLNDLKVVQIHEMDPPLEYTIYCIGGDGKSIITSDLLGEDRSIFYEFPTNEDAYRLTAYETDAGQYNLEYMSWNNPAKVVADDFAKSIPRRNSGYFGYTDEVQKLMANSDNNFENKWTDIAHGVKSLGPSDYPGFKCIMESPFIAWTIIGEAHLRDDFLIVTIGNDQICLIDPKEMKIALMARGSSPIIAYSPVTAE